MAKSLMIQGTASNAGKSLIAAAFCRIFHEDGYTVAPFKSQNMALNSYITADGLEIGRAQAVQAEAAGIAPTVDMNPILLKPSSDTGSQVIVRGEVLGNYIASRYYETKATLRPKVLESYETLAQQYDVVVLEGAGSPAEINLKRDDFVNMGMAEMAKSPVLLVGDIDRGGVFASLYGTLALLEPEERAMVKGLLINKFRGDPALLRPGLEQLESLTGKPVLGVIPWMNVEIDEEDSLSQRLWQKSPGRIDVAVIRFPRLSNFTDFSPLDFQDDLAVRYVDRASGFGTPDLVILPGTKNTMGDLLWMRENGLESMVKKYASRNGIVFGICGGYQMLCERLEDRFNVEHGGTMTGMGLLPGATVFARQKNRSQTSGRFLKVEGALKALSGASYTGYEIHMGVTDTIAPLVVSGKGEQGGAQSGNCYGAYVHGIFDGEAAARLAQILRNRKGLSSPRKQPDFQSYREAQYDLLAKTVRSHVDMERIYQILNRGLCWNECLADGSGSY